MGKDVTMHRSGNPTLCPALTWAETIRRLQDTPGFQPNWPVYKTLFIGKVIDIPSSDILTDIRAAVRRIGRDKLGFSPQD
eukprot:1187180-Ditylum_brightwellii.AAC.1